MSSITLTSTSNEQITTSDCSDISRSTASSEDDGSVQTHFRARHFSDDSDDDHPPSRTTIVERALAANERISAMLRRLKVAEEHETELENKISSRISLLKSIRSFIRHDIEAVEITDDDYNEWLQRKQLAKRVNFIPTVPDETNKNYVLEPNKDTAVQVSSERLKVSLNTILSEKKLLVDDSEYEEWLQKKFPQYAQTIMTGKSSTEFSSDVSIKPDFTTESIMKLKRELNELSFDAEFNLKPMEYTKWSDFSIVSKTKDKKISIKKEKTKVISNKFFSINTLKTCFSILTSLEIWIFFFMVILYMYYGSK